MVAYTLTYKVSPYPVGNGTSFNLIYWVPNIYSKWTISVPKRGIMTILQEESFWMKGEEWSKQLGILEPAHGTLGVYLLRN